jgi:hypothetical protein
VLNQLSGASMLLAGIIDLGLLALVIVTLIAGVMKKKITRQL